MKKKGKKLEFVSFIKRDGSGTIMCGVESDSTISSPETNNMDYLDEVTFDLNKLSLTEKTYIASGFNSFVVKLKKKKTTKMSETVHYRERK